jgi:SpoU rRNA methylase family enzyme
MASGGFGSVKKVTSDLRPIAMSTVSGKWIVMFVLNSVEFSTQEIDSEEEAREIMQRVTERVGEWAEGGHVWVEETDEETHIQN